MRGKPLKLRRGEGVLWEFRIGEAGWDYCQMTGIRHVDPKMDRYLRRRRKGGRKLKCGLCGQKLSASIRSIDEWM